MAKRIQFRAHGGPEVLEFVDYSPAAFGPQQVRVRNQAIGLAFIDTYYRGGPTRCPNCRPGYNEGAGVVDVVGSDVHNVSRATAWPMAPVTGGGISELHVLPAANGEVTRRYFV